MLAFQKKNKASSACQFLWRNCSYHGRIQAFSIKSQNTELGEVCTASCKSCPCVCQLSQETLLRDAQTRWRSAHLFTPIPRRWVQHSCPRQVPCLLPPFSVPPSTCQNNPLKPRSEYLLPRSILPSGSSLPPRPCAIAFTLGLFQASHLNANPVTPPRLCSHPAGCLEPFPELPPLLLRLPGEPQPSPRPHSNALSLVAVLTLSCTLDGIIYSLNWVTLTSFSHIPW